MCLLQNNEVEIEEKRNATFGMIMIGEL